MLPPHQQVSVYMFSASSCMFLFVLINTVEINLLCFLSTHPLFLSSAEIYVGKLLLLGVNNGRGGHTEAPELKVEGLG